MLAAILVLIFFGLLVLAATLVIVYLTYDTRMVIGFVPMPNSTQEVVIRALRLSHEAVLLDLGAGDGRVLSTVRKTMPGVRCIGYEKNPILSLRQRIWNPGLEWHRSDLMKADLSQATHVIIYLNRKLNDLLAQKLLTELPRGVRVISVRTDLPGLPLIEERLISDAPAHAMKLYIYET